METFKILKEDEDYKLQVNLDDEHALYLSRLSFDNGIHNRMFSITIEEAKELQSFLNEVFK